MSTLRFAWQVPWLMAVGWALAFTPIGPIEAQVAPSQDPPQFRAGTDLVRVVAVVLDDDRRPVRGLTEADFSLRVSGKVQPIRAFAEVDVPSAAVSQSSTADWTREIAPDVEANTISDEGRLVVIFFDRSIPPGPKLLAAKVIARTAVGELRHGDLAAVVAVRGRPSQDLTADRSRLLRAIDGAYPGSAEGEDEKVLNQGRLGGGQAILEANEACSCNTCVLDQIREIARTLTAIPRPKVLLFIGSQITTAAMDIDPVGGPLSGAAQMCTVPVTEARKAMYRALDAANVVIHSVDPSGLESGPGLAAASPVRGSEVYRQVRENQVRSAAYHGQIRVLPDRTGGRVITNTNAPQSFVPAVLNETSSYYVIGFDIPPVAQASTLELRTSRRGATVRTQRSYEPGAPDMGMSMPPLDTPTSPARVASSPAATLVTRAVESVLPARGLPLTANVLPMRVPGSKNSVALIVLGLEPSRSGTRDSDGSVTGFELLVGAFDQRARLEAEDRGRVETRSEEGSVPGHYDLLSMLALKPGTHEIRAGVAMPDLRAGSVMTYVDVPDFQKEPLSLSGLAVTTTPSSSTGVVMGDAGDLLPFVPTSRRTFRQSEILRVFLRAYQGGSAAVVPVKLEVRILDSRGSDMLNSTDMLAVERFATDRAADVALDLPLSALAPGEYLLSIGVVNGSHAARRDARFSVR